MSKLKKNSSYFQSHYRKLASAVFDFFYNYVHIHNLECGCGVFETFIQNVPNKRVQLAKRNTLRNRSTPKDYQTVNECEI